jgi:manganese transport protein
VLPVLPQGPLEFVVQLKRLSGLFLGVLTAVGGFVDMGGIITAAQAGAQHRFALLWTLVPGVIGLIVYADMSGRVVIASGRTLFDVIRDRLGFRLALIPLVATLIVNTLTLVVELAGMTLALELATHLSYLLWIPFAALCLAVILWKASFDLLENGSAVLGLTMLVAVVAMIKLAPSWGQVGIDVLHPSMATAHSYLLYWFAAISLLGGYMTPYQFYFYSSGAVEEEWSGQELLINRVTSIVGSAFGAIIDLALIVIAALVLFPHHLPVNTLGDAGLAINQSLGGIGWALFIVGAFAVSMGAGLETALSGAYAACQYFGWDWGKHARPREAPIFHLGYLVMVALAMALALTGIDPIKLTVVTLALGAASLPFTFLPLLIIANDPDYMGEQKNTLPLNIVAIILLVMLTLVTIVAVPLIILTGGGS